MTTVVSQAVAWARGAGDILRQHLCAGPTISTKSTAIDLVTSADHAAEAHLKACIRGAFPDHAVLAEESGSSGDAPYRWVLDPLDGTVNFAHGVPHFAVLIALQERSASGAYRTVLGVTLDPMRDELYVAERGGGATLNGQRLRVSAADVLIRSSLATGFGYDRLFRPDDNHAEFCRLNLLTRGVRRFGAAGLDLAWVAGGRLDGFWEYRLNLWDFAGGVLLVEEAGGRATDLGGSDIDPGAGNVLATNGTIHAAVVAALASAHDDPVNARVGLTPHLPPELASELARRFPR